jgi:hypothetical protein
MTFPTIPTIDQFKSDNHLLGTYQMIAELEKLRVSIQKPNKPIKPVDFSSDSFRKYANDLETYETKLEEYQSNFTLGQIHNMKVDARILDFIKIESGLNNVPEQYREKLFRKAWSDGHSSGYYEVYQQMCELVEIFE